MLPTRRTLGRYIIGTIFSFLDILDYKFLLKKYPESTSVWRQYTKYDDTIRKIEAAVYPGGTLYVFGRYYYCNDKLHSDDDMPAVVSTALKEWYRNGKRHRDNGPAVIKSNHITGHITSKEWYVNGVRHRVDGPAVISDKHDEWYLNGVLHCIDGPAYKDSIVQKWYRNGKLYRTGGEPTIVHTNGTLEWRYGKKLHSRNDQPAIIHWYGVKEWYCRGKLHRFGGRPAVEYPDGKRIKYNRGHVIETFDIRVQK